MKTSPLSPLLTDLMVSSWFLCTVNISVEVSWLIHFISHQQERVKRTNNIVLYYRLSPLKKTWRKSNTCGHRSNKSKSSCNNLLIITSIGHGCVDLFPVRNKSTGSEDIKWNPCQVIWSHQVFEWVMVTDVYLSVNLLLGFEQVVVVVKQILQTHTISML